MEYAAFVFGIFGLVAFLEVSSLKSRIDELERALTKMNGTTYHEERISLLSAVRGYVGQKVDIEFKEDHGDVDIMSYGNSKHGSNTIMDADEDWIFVHIESPKGDMDKLIRMESIKRITAK